MAVTVSVVEVRIGAEVTEIAKSVHSNMDIGRFGRIEGLLVELCLV
jgi:hypothetical protein